ncbi:hypothetical protein H4219_000064 [Mycoemilia scoparia]|uniref:VLRF1 domain-containing protein n=1 Tax=Mycoemilia scoparia TaxID=417184 RepID=A0A9W8A9V7_9FUNG|nr:hypothetical protein H4219_000064 [Mycoemilia scoparia]
MSAINSSPSSVFHIPKDLLDSLVPWGTNSEEASPKVNTDKTTSITEGLVKLKFSIPESHKNETFIDQKHFGEARTAVAACSTCQIQFDTVQEQRLHYRSSWHGFNTKNKALNRTEFGSATGNVATKWQPVSREEYEGIKCEGDPSSAQSQARVDSSASVTGNKTPSKTLSDNSISSLASTTLVDDWRSEVDDVETSRIWFYEGHSFDKDSAGRKNVSLYGIHKQVLLARNQRLLHTNNNDLIEFLKAMQISPSPSTPPSSTITATTKSNTPSRNCSYWILLRVSGGRFVGAVFDNSTGKMATHKTFSRYTTRRKQGGSQSANDNAKGRLAKSAGAQLRRMNELKLVEDIQALLKQWKQYFDTATHIFVRVFGANKYQLLGENGAGLAKNDPRIRSCPNPVASSDTLEDLCQAYYTLQSVKVKTVELRHFEKYNSTTDTTCSQNKQKTTTTSNGYVSGKDSTSDHESESEKYYDSESTLDPEPHPDLVAFLYTAAGKIRNSKLSDKKVLEFLKSNVDKLIDAFLDPALELRYLKDIGENDPSKTPTLLHLASKHGRHPIIPFLLDNGDDPKITNGHPPLFAAGKTPYEISKNRETRDAFRRYRADHEEDEDCLDWAAARIPQGLTKDQEMERDRREREKKERNELKRKEREMKRLLESDSSSKGETLNEQPKQTIQTILSQTNTIPEDWRRRGNVLGGSTVNVTTTHRPNRPVSPETLRRINRELSAKAIDERIRRMKNPC